MKANRWESFLTSWKFFSLLVVLQFILMPVATKDFRFEAAGDIVFYTLQHAFYSGYVFIQLLFSGGDDPGFDSCCSLEGKV